MARKHTMIELYGGGALYSQTPESYLEELGVSIKYPCPTGEGRVRGLRKEILRPRAEVLSMTSTTNAQNDKGVNNKSKPVILSKNCGEEEQFKNLGERSKKDHLPEFLNSHPFIKKFFSQHCALLLYTSSYEKFQNRMQRMVCPLTPSPIWKGVKKSAFTLAEILVTFGVIGIIAAMTIPMLARNYQFYIRQQQFKKAYAELSIAVQKTQIDMGEGVKCFWLKNDVWAAGNWDDCDYFYSELVKNMQVLKSCEKNALIGKCVPDNMRGGEEVYADTQGGSDKNAAIKEFNDNKACNGYNTEYIQNRTTAYLLNPNITLIRRKLDTSKFSDSWAPEFIVDINGHSNPNKWGHDIFLFKFIKLNDLDSVFRVEPSQRCHPLDVGGYYSTHFFNYLYGQNAEL